MAALLTCALCCLALGAAGNPKAVQPEAPRSAGYVPARHEEGRATGGIQYKTAEIADAMQSSSLEPDPAVLLAMLPKDRAGLGTACGVAMGAAECVANDSDPGDPAQEQSPKLDASTADTEQAREGGANTTDGSKPLKVNCEERNATELEERALQILNVSQDLMDFLNPNSSECTLVLFFTPWCQFSAALAPHFNALPRAFPGLQFLALDASQHSSLSTRFGTVAVPNILLFQGAKPMARFNQSERNLESFKSFIFNQSGIEAKPDIFVVEADHEGPLPSTPQSGIDWLLVFSVVYVTSFIVYATMQTDRIRWLIPGQEHEHQD